MNRVSMRSILAFAAVAVTITAITANSSPRKIKKAEDRFLQTNLVSDIPGLAAFTDSNLVNAWGISHSGTSPFWISDNGAGVTTLYNGAGQLFPTASPLVVTIPNPAGSDPSRPTGQVFNSFSNVGAFAVAANKPAVFIFATEDGTISGWNPGVLPKTAVQMVNNSGSAIYKGLAIGSADGNPYLYAANFHAGSIDVFDANFGQVHWVGAFQDSQIKGGYAPFNVQNLGGLLYVAYAMQDADKVDEIAGPSRGFVDVFDTSGHLIKRLAKHGLLNAPWGMTIAPASFGSAAGMLLVGNFGNGRITIVDPNTGEFIDQLRGPDGRHLEIDGLWALDVGNDHNAGSSSKVYFTAGPGDESHGLFGSLELAP